MVWSVVAADIDRFEVLEDSLNLHYPTIALLSNFLNLTELP